MCTLTLWEYYNSTSLPTELQAFLKSFKRMHELLILESHFRNEVAILIKNNSNHKNDNY
jgi:hypothetical protein